MRGIASLSVEEEMEEEQEEEKKEQSDSEDVVVETRSDLPRKSSFLARAGLRRFLDIFSFPDLGNNFHSGDPVYNLMKRQR